MKCREPTRLHRKSGFVEGMSPKARSFHPSLPPARRLLKSESGPPTLFVRFWLGVVPAVCSGFPRAGGLTLDPSQDHRRNIGGAEAVVYIHHGYVGGA